ncbi:MAG: hypothetical protein AAGI53_10985 [Planctomycetota bacterium]
MVIVIGDARFRERAIGLVGQMMTLEPDFVDRVLSFMPSARRKTLISLGTILGLVGVCGLAAIVVVKVRAAIDLSLQHSGRIASYHLVCVRLAEIIETGDAWPDSMSEVERSLVAIRGELPYPIDEVIQLTPRAEVRPGASVCEPEFSVILLNGNCDDLTFYGGEHLAEVLRAHPEYFVDGS